MVRHPGFKPVPVFSEQELDAQRQRAIALFIQERAQEGDASYRQAFETNRKLVERLFLSTKYLSVTDGNILSANPDLIEVARFLAAPPVSEDDLDTLVGRRVATRKTLPAELAQAAFDVLGAMIDTIRCPWLREERAPSAAEIKEAIDWTAGLLTVEQLRTERRTESAKRQQEAVAQLLLNNGWQEAPRRPIQVLDDLPRGHFSRESDVWGAKCDVPIRLHDGRLLALECKVSNSATNSVKRLIRETCGKASTWRQAAGDQIITGAVLAGVFKMKNLLEAQDDHHVVVFWEHDLSPLLQFISSGGVDTPGFSRPSGRL